MRHMMIRAIPLLAILALAGCDEEDTDDDVTQSSADPISIADLGTREWATSEEMTARGIARATDILATNNMIVLDMSGSMGESGCAGEHATRADAAKSALLTWISANPGDNVGLIAFNSNAGPELWHGLGAGAGHGQAVVATIQSLWPDAGTPLSTAMAMAEDELRAQYVRQNGSGTYRMIVITDGQASDGFNPSEVVHDIASNPANPIELHTIGFCIRGDHSLKDPDAVFYVDANSPQDLVDGLNATQGEATGFNTADLNFEEIEE